MTHFFDRKDRWGNGAAVWVIMAMVFVTPLAWWSIAHTQLDNDVENWLPANDPELKTLHWSQSHFPAEERIFVTWDGSALNDSRVTAFVDKLRGQIDADGIQRGGFPHISKVVEPRDLLVPMQQNGVEPREAVRRLEGLILGAGPLRLVLSEFGKSGLSRTLQELNEGATERFGKKFTFTPSVADFGTQVTIPAPPAAEGETAPEPAPPVAMNASGQLIDLPSVEHDLQVSWAGIRPASEETGEIAKWMTGFTAANHPGKPLVQNCFFVLGSPITMALTISEAGLADKEETVDVIRKTAEACGVPTSQIHLAGSAISAVELNHEVRKAVWDRSIPIQKFHRRSVVLTSAILSAFLAYALVRSIRLATIVLLVSLYATLISTSLVSATGGTMNMVLVVMPSLLMVLTLSGAIHLANYWKHAACQNESTAIREAVRTSWTPCFLASLTTAIGLISLCTSSLSPVRDFGIYSAAGTMLSLGVIFLCVPSLLQLWPGTAPAAHELDHPGWRMLGRGLTRLPLLQSLVVMAICVACSYGLIKFRTETKVIRYFPEQARIAHDYDFIETNLAGIMPVETIIRFDAQSQKDTTFLDRLEVVRQIQERLRTHADITGSLSLADFLPVSEKLEDDATSLARMKFHKRANVIQERIRGNEIPAAKTFYSVADKAQDLKEPGDHALNQAEDELWRITSQVTIMNDHDFSVVLGDVTHVVRDVLRLHPGTMHTITGTVPLFLRTQQAVLYSLISSFGLAFVLILGVFVFMLRNFWAGLVAMIPNIMPITVVFGIISWLDQKVDVGTMITASIALGIAVDGTLHYLTWVQTGMRSGQSRNDSIVSALVHCGPAMWQTSLAVALGLLVLVPADLLLISRFGWLMAALIGVALLGDIILMPQLLAGPLGVLFEPAKPNAKSGEHLAIKPPDESDSSTPLPAPHFNARSGSESSRPAS